MSAMTHLQLDSSRAFTVYTNSNRIPLTIAQLATTSIFLVAIVGWKGVLLGLLAAALTLPLTTKITKKFAEAQSELMKHHDRRSALLRNALLAIRQLKISAAEAAWERKMSECRKTELRTLFMGGMWMCGLVFVANISPIILSGVPLYVLALQGKPVSAAVSFTCISLFGDLQSALSIPPLNTTWIMGAWASLRRLEKYFAEQEATQSQNDTFGYDCVQGGNGLLAGQWK